MSSEMRSYDRFATGRQSVRDGPLACGAAVGRVGRAGEVYAPPAGWTPAPGQCVAPVSLPAQQRGEWILRAPGRWWVIYTRARHEKMIALALEKQEVCCYLPLVSVHHTYAKSKASFTLPLFPGYLFFCGEAAACDTVWRTNRVVTILPVHDQNRFRAELQQVCRIVSGGNQIETFPALREGRRCRIRSGPLKGIEGVVERCGKTKLYVGVTAVGQSAVLVIDAGLLEPVN